MKELLKGRISKVFLLGAVFFLITSAKAYGYCNVHQVDRLAVNLDRMTDALHEEIHHMVQSHYEVRQLDQATNALHRAAHHMHETAHDHGTCRHLEKDWRVVKARYHTYMYKLRAARCLWNDRNVSHYTHQIKWLYSQMQRQMEPRRDWDHGWHHGDRHDSHRDRDHHGRNDRRRGGFGGGRHHF